MTKDELIAKLKDIEWDDFEVKEAANGLPKSIWETVSAFSNTSGGWIVLGVKQVGKKFEITGVQNGEKIESDFFNVVNGKQKLNHQISVSAKKYNIQGKLVIAFYIPSSTIKPIYINSLQNTYLRSGSGDRRASEIEINAMFRDQAFGSKSEQVIDGSSIEMLNQHSLMTYRNRIANVNPDFPYNELPSEDFCEKTGITRRSLLTYGGLLMLGKRDAVQLYVSNFWIDMLEIPGTSMGEANPRYTFRMPEQENIWEYYNVLIQRLRLHVDAPFTAGPDGFAPDDNSQLYALREGLVNMLAHADYFSPMHSTVRVFTNRIEFQNAGRFMFDLKDLRVQMHSMPRNPLLVKLFRFAKLSENAEYGIDRMLTWEKLTNNSVEFSSDLVCSTVTYFRTVTTADSNNITENHPGESAEKSAEKSTEKSTEKILLYIRKKPTITIAELCEVMGMSDKGIRKNINVLKQKGILVRVGPDRGGHWEINEENLSEDIVLENDAENLESTEKNTEKILLYIRKKPTITIAELCEVIGMSDKGIRKNINVLKQKGILVRVGPDKGGHWNVVEPLRATTNNMQTP
ncbi:MAG: putative DNA binding domain-containing protein [Bacteroidales bacterium]|nr:putative DNA binding domain-containing protein [Bacteroidales bacterium]